MQQRKVMNNNIKIDTIHDINKIDEIHKYIYIAHHLSYLDIQQHTITILSCYSTINYYLYRF